MRPPALACALLLVASCRMSAAQEAAPRVDDPALAGAIAAYFAPLVSSNDISGTIRVERGTQVTEVSFGYADWSTKARITPETRFGSGSVAKSLIATVVLRLAEQGVLNTQAKVSAYLPDYRFGDRMTLTQVMHHTAGLPRDISQSDRAQFGANGLTDWLNAHPPAAPTATAVYSNVGYQLLARVAERASGQPLDTLLRTMIFDPLGMRTSSFESRNVNGRSALPHVPGLSANEVVTAKNEIVSPSGALFATPADLARWGRAVRDGRIVNLQQADGTMAGSVSTRQIAGRPALWMQGTLPGSGAVVVAFPGEDVVIVTAFNLESYSLFNSELAVAAIVFGGTPIAAPVRLPTTSLTAEHRALAGDYELPQLGRVRIHDAGSEMRITILGPGWSFYLSPASDGRLVWRAFNYTFAARRDSAGVVNGLKVRLHMIGDNGGDSETARLDTTAR